MTYDEMCSALVAKRKQLRLTQYELADLMGVHQSCVWRLEKRKINRSNMITLNRWATALDVHIHIDYTLEKLEDAA